MIRKTRQRSAIREALETCGRPMSPDEVLALAQKKVSGLGIATVYRNLKALVEEGWLVPVELPGEPARYELAGKDHHHHFHCRACGRVFELHGCVDKLVEMVPAGFAMTGHELVLYGLCGSCQVGRN
ncbi:MAG: transcriptional repressor [Bryobacteraceae bacterium]|nr:transcriptional repressor [Bryobacteraceae bacterium]